MSKARSGQDRGLSPGELVLKGQRLQLDEANTDVSAAKRAFQAALEIDGSYIPALLELAWFYHAVDDDVRQALPLFSKAIDISWSALQEALRGKAECLEEMDLNKRSQGLARKNRAKRPRSVYTFITEKEGSTIIEQFRGVDIREATLRWYRGSETKPGEPLLEIEEDPPTPITGCKGVWCISGHDPEGRFFLTNVVATKGPG